MRSTLVLLVFVVLVSSTATSVQAQEIATSFDQLSVLVSAGDRVTVTDFVGNQTKGKVLAVSTASLELSVDGTQRSWAESQVRIVSERRRASVGTGARRGFHIGASIGLLGGLGAGLIVGASAGEVVGISLLGAGVYGAVGAGIGAGVSAMRRESHVVYVGRPASPVVVTPVVLNHRKGMALSLRF